MHEAIQQPSPLLRTLTNMMRFDQQIRGRQKKVGVRGDDTTALVTIDAFDFIFFVCTDNIPR